MVKLLTDLKVAEIREALAARHESTEGKKAELLQRLSDWIEDNDFDPDTYDFAAADVPQRKQSSDEFSNSEPELSIVEENEQASAAMDAEDNEVQEIHDDDDEPLARIADYESCEDADSQCDNLQMNEDEVNLDELDFSEDIHHESEEMEIDENMKILWITKVRNDLEPKTAARAIRKFGIRCGIKFAKNKNETAILLSCESAKDAQSLHSKLNGELCGNIVDICVQDNDPTRRKTLIDLTNEDKNDELAALMKKIEEMDKTISEKRKKKNETQSKYRSVRQDISRMKRNIDNDLEAAVRYTKEKRDNERKLISTRRSIRDYRDEKRADESKQKRLTREKAETKAKLVTARNKMNKALEEERAAMKDNDTREARATGDGIRVSVPNEPDYMPEPEKFESEYARKKMAASEPVGVTRTIPNDGNPHYEPMMPNRRTGTAPTRGRGGYSARGTVPGARGRGSGHFRGSSSRGRGAPRGNFMPARSNPRKFQEPMTY